MEPPDSGTPPRRSYPVKEIALEGDTFDSWLAIKDSLGFNQKSNSEFADVLTRKWSAPGLKRVDK